MGLCQNRVNTLEPQYETKSVEPIWTYCPQCASELKEKEMGGFVRRVCSNEICTFVHYANPTPVVAALVEHEKGIILVRAPHWPASWFGLVTGFLEQGEEPGEAIVREVKEELNLQAEIIALIGNYSFPRNNEVIMAYHVKVTGEPRLGEELADYKYIPPAQLKPWPFGTGKAVNDWLKNVKREA